MNNIFFDVWAVHQGDDDRSMGTPVWFFDKEQMAKDIAKGRGWWGGVAPISKHSAIRINDQVYVVKSPKAIALNVGPEDIKEMKTKALAKLTETEKEILGLLK